MDHLGQLVNWFNTVIRLKGAHSLYAVFLGVLLGLAAIVAFVLSGISRTAILTVIILAALVLIFGSSWFLRRMPPSEQTITQLVRTNYWIKYIGDKPRQLPPRQLKRRSQEEIQGLQSRGQSENH